VIQLLLGGLLIRSAIAVWLPPGFDEAYYYLYTRHLDWSYFDHPLMVAWTTGFGVWLTGEVSPFTIRIGTLLLYTGSLFLLYRTSARLFCDRAALLTLAIASITPIFLLGMGVLTLPDSSLMIFWTAVLYVASHEFFPAENYRPSYRLAILGGLVGLACLSKYHGMALGFGLVGFCLTSSRHRSALTSVWTVVAVGLFLGAIAPIVIWNIQHDWISLRYQSGRAIPDRGYSVLDLLVTILAQVGYLFPTIGIPLWWVSLRTLWQQVRQREDTKLRLLLWLALPIMLGFTVMGGYRSILPTWAMPGFWSATLILGKQAAVWQERSPKRVDRWLWGSAIPIVTILLLLLLHVSTGTLQRQGRNAWFGGFISASADPSVQLLDIQQLRQKLAQSPAFKAALKQTEFVFTSELFLAGQIGMAIAPLTTHPITCLDDDPRGFAFWSTQEQWVRKNGLYFASEQRSRSPTRLYSSYFAQIKKIADIPIQRNGITLDVIQIYQCTTLLRPYPRPYGL
jgi:4-amino-4-deoxy-L-arabinose transferase-like glycosyltransferase